MSEPGERSLLKEEFDRLFGYEKDEVEGVRDWRISTLGPTNVGKTVLISGLYAQYHLGTEHGKDIGIESIGTELHDMLESVARGLRAKPARLPYNTNEIRNARLKLQVKGAHKRYQKIVTLQDHPGEHLLRSDPNHDTTLAHLKASDSFMVFIDSREILREDYHEAAEEMELQVIKGLIRDISVGLEDGDLMPISIVFSKADMVHGQEEAVIRKGADLFSGLSEELPQCILCFSTASVIRNAQPDRQDKFLYAPKNIEVPFLFSIAGTVVRNSNLLRMAADQMVEQKEELKTEQIDNLGFFERFFARVRKGAEVRRLDSKSKRYFSLSSYDLELARSAMNLIKLNKNVTFMQAGIKYDDVEDVFSELN